VSSCVWAGSSGSGVIDSSDITRPVSRKERFLLDHAGERGKHVAGALGALAVGAAAAGAGAAGALAIGRLAIGRLSVGRGRVAKLAIDELEVGRLTVDELTVRSERRPDATAH
jgi:hypothetical protein